MKRLIALILLCAGVSLAQDPIDSIRVRDVNLGGNFPLKYVEGYISGKWRFLGYVMPQEAVLGLKDTLTAIESSIPTNSPAVVVADTAAFTTNATRKAIYIVGCRDNQMWGASPRKLANTTLPVAGDLLVASPKWDSLIVKRQAGTTSGLKFNYWRIK